MTKKICVDEANRRGVEVEADGTVRFFMTQPEEPNSPGSIYLSPDTARELCAWLLKTLDK